MIKFRLYFDKDKETAWLNEMAEQGYAMTGFFAGFFHFEECEPGEYEYQIDFGDKFFSVSNNYREFMEETGVEIIQCWGFWIVLRQKASEGAFQLYTDVDSSIEHYSKILRMFKIFTIIELLCLFMEIYAATTGTALAYAFTCIIGAIIIAFLRMIIKAKQTIIELRERKGEVSESYCGKRNISLFLSCGLLLNSCALFLEDSISHNLKLGCQLLAIVFLLIGTYRTARRRCQK